jgi:hypothetical protein
MLWRYRQAVGRTGETRLGRLTALASLIPVEAAFGSRIAPEIAQGVHYSASSCG